MDQSQALKAFAALSDATRLDILRFLVRAGPDGAAASAIADAVTASPSRLSFHLSKMSEAGLVRATRRSRQIIYSLRYENLGALVTFLMQDCCQGAPELRRCCGL